MSFQLFYDFDVGLIFYLFQNLYGIGRCKISFIHSESWIETVVND